MGDSWRPESSWELVKLGSCLELHTPFPASKDTSFGVVLVSWLTNSAADTATEDMSSLNASDFTLVWLLLGKDLNAY